MSKPVLYDSRGQVITSKMFKKEDPPKLGPSYGVWSGDATGVQPFLQQMPGGAMIQFDLSKLSLADFRAMRTHPAVNTALSVLSFMQHQSEWTIEHPDAKVRDFLTEQITKIWTQLSRTMAQSNWAGFSPGALEWENDVENKQVVIHKVKDLVPENCVVHWKEIEGYAPPGKIKPKFKIYDGIKQFGQVDPIPVPNTFWYPILMENGNYYGRRLLEAAFTPYYFSTLIHIYANRYYERFGEPQAVGRAPYDEGSAPEGSPANVKTGYDYMANTLQGLRSHGVVVLPNDGQQDSSGKFHFDYDISFLESQMRGADFERYLTRLDEEISLALFTPTLLMRVADVGSYSLGEGHMQVYLWMMNVMNDDRAEYINKYIIAPLVRYNFNKNTEPARLKFKKLGATNQDLIKDILTSLANGKQIAFDLEELGEAAGLTLKQVEQLTEGDPGVNPALTPEGKPEEEETKPKPKAKSENSIAARVVERLRPHIERLGPNPSLEDLPDWGYAKQLASLLASEGVEFPARRAAGIFAAVQDSFVGQTFLTPAETAQFIEGEIDANIAAVLRSS